MKQSIHKLLGILSAFCLMFTLLITSVEAVCYWTPGYFQHQYEKYHVLDSLPAMTMEDLLDVTDEMMDYLKGNREDLHVQTTMEGETREFFSEREIAHMEDVQGLFLAAIMLRRFCILFILLSLAVIAATKGSIPDILPRAVFLGTLLFFGIAAAIGLLVSTNFSKYFVVFHHIFFDNDLWILDPSVDMLINIVPEGFFRDTAMRIILLFGVLALTVLAVSFLFIRKGRIRRPKGLFRMLAVISLLSILISVPAMAAPAWPESSGIQADGGILIDAASGTVLYEKNADQPYYPASITKILTALIIIENCNLDDLVTFSRRAVNDVEAGSSNMGVLPGDELTVRDCLYGLMLASANECANALAEHCSGSIEEFIVLMNQKAAELGCTGSHFANPSGLNGEDHYVTARDMALITKAAIENPTFLEIDGALYWTHAPIKHYPDPEDPHNTIYAHHGMLKRNNSNYYEGAFAGKTGYTSLAGNTLVTCARRDDTTLICVILNGHQTHYQDTKTLLDFGFRNFRSVPISDYHHSYTSMDNDMTISGLTLSPISSLSMDEDCYLTLPKSADFHEAETVLNYQLPEDAPVGSIAEISYHYAGHYIGSSYLMLKNNQNSLSRMEAAANLTAAETIGIPEPTTKPLNAEEEEAQTDTASSVKAIEDGQVPAGHSDLPSHQEPGWFSLKISSAVWVIFALTIVFAGIITAVVVIRIHMERRAEAELYFLRERRKQRLNDIGLTPSEFDLVIQERKRSSYRASRNKRHNKRPS